MILLTRQKDAKFSHSVYNLSDPKDFGLGFDLVITKAWISSHPGKPF